MMHQHDDAQPRGMVGQGRVETRQRQAVDAQQRAVRQPGQQGRGPSPRRRIGIGEAARHFMHDDVAPGAAQRLDHAAIIKIAAGDLVEPAGNDEAEIAHDFGSVPS